MTEKDDDKMVPKPGRDHLRDPVPHPVLDDDGQVLVSTDVRRPGTTDCCQGCLSTCLRPAVAVQVRQQAIVRTAVQVYGSTERRL